MPLVQAAFGPQGRESKQEALTGCCRAALERLRCPDAAQATALLEYKDWATLFARLAQPGQPLATKSNREIWGHCLDEAFSSTHFPGRDFQHIPDLSRFYQSIEDGSCAVERGLAGVRAFIQEFRCDDIDAMDDIAVLGGAQLKPEDLTVESHGSWQAGPFGLACGAIWREVIGARLGIYNKDRNATKVSQKPGTYKHVKAGVYKAIGVVTTSPNQVGQPLAAGHQPSLASALAQRGGSSKAGTPQCPFWHKGFYYGSLPPRRSATCKGLWVSRKSAQFDFFGGLLNLEDVVAYALGVGV